MLKVGLLGAGRIGQVHAANIAAHHKSILVAVADINEEAAKTLANTYGATPMSVDAIIADETINAVLIATSTDTHADLMEAASRAGKAILCEKPVDLDLARARACLSSLDGSGQPILIGFNRRFDNNFRTLKKSLQNGNIGNPELLTITSFDPAPPPVSYVKVSGGLFRDMMIHDFDLANFLMETMPQTISTAASGLVDPEIAAAGDVDTAAVTMRYADGRIAIIKNSRRAAYGYDQRVEVLGSEGLLEADNMRENTVTRSTRAGVTSANPQYFFLERYHQAYIEEWDSFVQTVLEEKPAPVTLEDGVNALAMAEAATRSLKTGAPVDLNDV